MAPPKGRNPNNPWWNPALGCELTPRERRALMTKEDWDEVVKVTLIEEKK